MTELELKKSSKSKIVTLIILACTILISIYTIWHVNNSPETDDAYAYADTINVAPEVNGRIIEMMVKENQHVKKGDILFKIDPRPYQYVLDKAIASLAMLNKSIELAQRNVDAQKYAADAAHANVKKAEAALKQATETLNRLTPLLGNGYVSIDQVTQAQNALHGAQAQLLAAQSDAQRATAAISGVDDLIVKRDITEAEIAQAKLNLTNTTVVAPFDGRVTNLTTTVGQFATIGNPVFTLIDSEHWFVIANFRETELNKIKQGMKVRVYLLSDTNQSFTGYVDSIGFGVHPDDGGSSVAGLPQVKRDINWVRVAQRFPVRINVEQANQELFRVGTSAVATIISDDVDIPSK